MKKYLVAFLTALISMNSAAESILKRKNIFDTPSGLDPASAKEWNEATCKWRILSDDTYVGMGGADSPETCFAQGRMVMIYVDQNPEYNFESKKGYRQEMILIFDDQNGNRQACHALPVKEPYDQITIEEFTKDLLANNGEHSKSFLKRLNENVLLQCMMM